MPGKPAPGNDSHTFRAQTELWLAFKAACDRLGVSRNQRLIHHMQADVDAAQEQSEEQ